MEVRGLVLLRVSDPDLCKVAVVCNNNDKQGFQMQVCVFHLFIPSPTHSF